MRALGRAVHIYVSGARRLLVASAIAVLIVAAMSLLPSVLGALGVLTLIVDVGVLVLFTAVVTELVSELHQGRPNSQLRVLVRCVRPALGQLLASGLAAGVATILLFSLGSALAAVLLLAAVLEMHAHLLNPALIAVIGVIVSFVPGLLLLTMWSVAGPVAVLERPGGLGALGRSRELVRRSRRRVLVVMIALVVSLSIVGRIVNALSDAGTVPGTIAGVLVGIVLAPMLPMVSTLLYFELAGLDANAQ